MIGMNYQIQLEKSNTINAFESFLEDQWKDADLNFKGHVYVTQTICVRFNDFHL